jgi:hypothetical protein
MSAGEAATFRASSPMAACSGSVAYGARSGRPIQRFLSYSRKREHVLAIESAKKAETRIRRIEKALAMLRTRSRQWAARQRHRPLANRRLHDRHSSARWWTAAIPREGRRAVVLRRPA